MCLHVRTLCMSNAWLCGGSPCYVYLPVDAVRRREYAPTNVCAQRALCYADNLSIKPNAQIPDANIACGFMNRWRVEN